MDEELIAEFTIEAKEHLETIEEDILTLKQQESEPDPELVHKVFRAMHSIKGGAGFLGLDQIQSMAHVMESIFKLVGDHKLFVNDDTVGVLLEGCDKLGQIFEDIANAENIEITETHERLSELLQSQGKDSGVSVKPSSLNAPLPKPKVTEMEAETIDPSSLTPAFEITQAMRQAFAEDAIKLLSDADDVLMTIEMGGGDGDTNNQINELFRLIHSFKGNCGFFQIISLETFAHALESILYELRQNQIKPTSDLVIFLLQALDALREAVTGFGEQGKINFKDYKVLLKRARNEVKAFKKEETEPKTESADETQEEDSNSNASQGDANIPDASVETQKTETKPKLEIKLPESKAVKTLKLPKPKPVAEASTASKTDNKPQSSPAGGTKGRSLFPKAAETARQDIRVDINKLDILINLVGELVIANQMVVGHPSIECVQDESLERAIHHLTRISAELQDVAMTVRMVPLSATFKKMTRLVHDVSAKSKKKVQLEQIGGDTEVDKNVIELIGDPLVHILRNAVDHGLEKPEDRVRAGKDETGKITLEARHESGEVQLIIKDDGAGINRERVAQKALESGLITGDPETIPDEDIFKMIFEPGFSTAAEVTDLSGRGVGMDVVKKNIEKLRGRINIRSKKGEGSTFILHIPLTLAIIDGMLVRVGEAKYTIPLLSIRESFRPSQDQLTITPEDEEIVKVRDELIPVLRLHKRFKVSNACENLEDGILIVVQSGDERACVFVDEIIGQQGTVIKGLSNYIGDVSGLSGCTILGDGRVSLILDVGGLIKNL